MFETQGRRSRRLPSAIGHRCFALDRPRSLPSISLDRRERSSVGRHARHPRHDLMPAGCPDKPGHDENQVMPHPAGARARSPISPEPSARRRRQDGRRDAGRLARARPRRQEVVVVIEPQPASEVAALAQRGVRLNPPAARSARRRRSCSRSSRRSRPRCCRRSGPTSALRPLRSRSWRAARSRFSNRRLPRRRDRPRHAEHAGRDRPRHHGRGGERQGLRTAARNSSIRCCRRPAQSNGSATRR